MAALPLMLGGSIISSILGGIFGSKAASTQAAAAINASNAANQTQFNQQQLTRSDLAPYTNLGAGASTALQNYLGIGPKPDPNATPQQAVLPADIQDKQRTLQFYQDWLANKNPLKADGTPIGAAPHNPQTIAKVQAEIAQLQRDIQSGTQIAQNSANQANAVNQQDPSTYGSLMKDFTLADFNADPGYNFRLSEGAKALERSAAAKGGLFSGGTLKALTDYNQNFASNEFNNAYNRFQQNRQTKYNFLSGATQTGQSSAAQQANLGQDTANNIAQNTAEGITAAANARASSYANWANAINSGINSAGNIWMNRNLINSGNGYPPVSPGYPPIYTTPPFNPSSQIPTRNPHAFGTGVYN